MRPGELVQLPAQGDDRAAPELSGVGVPDYGGVVVIAVQAQRPAQGRVVVGVPFSAGDLPTVRAEAGVAPGAASGYPPVGGRDAGVDRSEGGAVRVAKTQGWMATDSGTPLPPASPARMSW